GGDSPAARGSRGTGRSGSRSTGAGRQDRRADGARYLVNDLMEINLAIAGRARSGADLTTAEIDELATTDVLSLGMLPDELRRARVGARVTFVRVHDWTPGCADVPYAASEIRLSVLAETLNAATAEVRRARAVADGRRVSGFSLAQVVDRARSGWGSLAQVLSELRQSGLDAIAHAPVDDLPDAQSALRESFIAGLTVGCLSVQRPIGSDRTELLIEMRTLVSEFPQITTVAPLPREQSTMVPTTGYDDVRIVALARLAVST